MDVSDVSCMLSLSLPKHPICKRFPKMARNPHTAAQIPSDPQFSLLRPGCFCVMGASSPEADHANIVQISWGRAGRIACSKTVCISTNRPTSNIPTKNKQTHSLPSPLHPWRGGLMAPTGASSSASPWALATKCVLGARSHRSSIPPCMTKCFLNHGPRVDKSDRRGKHGRAP